MKTENKDSFFDYTAQNSQSKDYPMSQHKNKLVLVVNVASKCGFTKQYSGLEELYKKYHDKGFEIIGFPCNQFGGQEPGSDDEIQSFCSMNYGVTFPVLSKVDVNGSDTHPIYQFLKSNAPGILGTEAIKWNFTKFLIGKDGKVLKRYAPNTEPIEISGELETLLK